MAKKQTPVQITFEKIVNQYFKDDKIEINLKDFITIIQENMELEKKYLIDSFDLGYFMATIVNKDEVIATGKEYFEENF